LTRPDRLVESAWVGHIPFAFWIIAAHRPHLLVELGTHNGSSYCAFCQAVAQLGLDTACFAVDTWVGDPQAGFYGEEVYDELRRYHDARYGAFSRLVRSTFDEALEHFADGSIDLLHIDGYHVYDVVRHDFESWLPKLSPRGILLFHDINVRERDFGAWRLWDEVSVARSHFAFHHYHGLGVLAVGPEQSEYVRALLAATGRPEAATVRQWFGSAARAIQTELELARMEPLVRHRAELEAALQDSTRHRAELEAALQDAARHRAELEAELERAWTQGAAAESELRRLREVWALRDADLAAAERQRVELTAELDRGARERELALVEIQKLHSDTAKLLDARRFLARQLEKEHRKRQRLRRSISWRLTKPLRLIGTVAKRLGGGEERSQTKPPRVVPPAVTPSAQNEAPACALERGPEVLPDRIRQLRVLLEAQPEPDATAKHGRHASRITEEGLPWLEPRHRSQFLLLQDSAPRGRIAVVAHVYYPDLWPELSSAIANIEEPFDLFVSLAVTCADTMLQSIIEAWPFAHVLIVENRGRDILPFLSIARTGVLFRYELVCKLHTKRSHWHEDGETWRKDLIDGVLGNRGTVQSILHAFSADPDLGMVVADGHLYSGRELWEGNRKHLTRLFSYLGMDETEFGKDFAGGSIFWIRPAFLRLISDLPFRFEDFEPEPLGNDGCLVHAIERLISLACYEAGMTIKETSTILRLEAEEEAARDRAC
jgi:hypothetical protein